jgi:hypothetical protein
MMGNKQHTIPHALQYEVPDGAATNSRQKSGTGSSFFEINVWMWLCGKAFPRKISVEDAKEMRLARVSESRSRGAETLKRHSLATAARDGKKCLVAPRSIQ